MFRKKSCELLSCGDRDSGERVHQCRVLLEPWQSEREAEGAWERKGEVVGAGTAASAAAARCSSCLGAGSAASTPLWGRRCLTSKSPRWSVALPGAKHGGFIVFFSCQERPFEDSASFPGLKGICCHQCGFSMKAGMGSGKYNSGQDVKADVQRGGGFLCLLPLYSRT